MNLSERIVDYLRKHKGEVICDACFQAQLGTRHPLTGMLIELNPAHIARKIDRCGKCGEMKETICLFAEPTKEELAAKRREIREAWNKRKDSQ